MPLLGFSGLEKIFRGLLRLDEDSRDEILEFIEEEKVRLVEDLMVIQERSLDSRIQDHVPLRIENIEGWITERTAAIEAPESLNDGETSQGFQEKAARIEDALGSLTHEAKEAGFIRRIEAEEQGQTLLIATIVTTISAFFIVLGLAWMMCGPIIRRFAQIKKFFSRLFRAILSFVPR